MYIRQDKIDYLKTLLINRHAKSDWGNSDLRDYDRPLNKRGLKDRVFMSDQLANRRIRVDMIVTSSALRAKTTAHTFAEKLGIKGGNYVEEDGLYLASLRQLAERVNALPNEAETVMIFGHNPGLSYLVDYYTGQMTDMPTCAVAIIEFDIEDWALASAQMGTLVDFDYPKKHKA